MTSISSRHRNVYNSLANYLLKFTTLQSAVRMAERSKAPDSRDCTIPSPVLETRVFWSTYVGVGSNPTSDNLFLLFRKIFLQILLTKKYTKSSREPDLNQRPKDSFWCFAHYSPPLYQLSYHGSWKLHFIYLLRRFQNPRLIKHALPECPHIC